jgi:hypothetical protein
VKNDGSVSSWPVFSVYYSFTSSELLKSSRNREFHPPNMSNDHKKGPGGHYSGANPIPNIQNFVDSLNQDKKQRGANNNEETKARAAQGGAKDHAPSQPTGVLGTRKTVTDPTTGREVQIEDVNADFMKSVHDPVVRTSSQSRSELS